MGAPRLKPGDPEVVAAVVERIRNMPREELLQRLREREDFDEAWIQPQPGSPSKRGKYTRTTKVRRRCRIDS